LWSWWSASGLRHWRIVAWSWQLQQLAARSNLIWVNGTTGCHDKVVATTTTDGDAQLAQAVNLATGPLLPQHTVVVVIFLSTYHEMWSAGHAELHLCRSWPI
jgi:hypothetical protein